MQNRVYRELFGRNGLSGSIPESAAITRWETQGRISPGHPHNTFIFGGNCVEVWKDIFGYEGLYQVSNLGNVRSLNWGNRHIVRNLYLKPHRNGYFQVELSKDGSKKMFTVHRLVAIHFVEGYADGLVVNHINENKQDNRSENLEWCTISQNARHSLNLHPERISKLKEVQKESRYHPQKGAPIKCRERIEQITRDNVFVREWESAISIRRELGYNEWSIKECCKGNRHTAYGYKWRFAT